MVKLLNGARLLATKPFTFETPAIQWAFALSVPLGTLPKHAAGDEVLVDLEVRRGAVGVGPVASEVKRFLSEHHVGEHDGRILLELRVEPNEACERLVVRNMDPDAQPATVVIHSIAVGPASKDRPVDPVVDVPSALLHRFQPFSGTVEGGFTTNWLGVRTRAHVYPYSAELQEVYGRSRHEAYDYQLTDEHVLDWIPLLEAVTSAAGEFRMIALGAGWGRWLSGGAAAARQLSLPFHLTGVEAERQHFAWMQEHMEDNAIPMSHCRLIRAAASGSRDPCWFPVEEPNWYGQAILGGAAVPDGAESLATVERYGHKYEPIPAVTIDDLISPADCIDYLHMDIQGTEFQFLARNPELLDRTVRLVNIGTHTGVIERRLRHLFGVLNWMPRYDISLGSAADVVVDGQTIGRVQFGDGVQVWSNPKLHDRGSR